MQNKTLLTDFYQLTMMQGYFKLKRDEQVTMDMFFRKNPCGNGYTIISGISELVSYIQNINFTKEDIAYLKSLDKFDSDFLEFLHTFKFNGTINAVEEGSIMFPHEPIVQVQGNIIEASFIETALLSIINHQSLIATKASRICESAGDNEVVEFGLRRAQGLEAGLYGAKAAVVGGCAGTSNVLAAKEFEIPIIGTHSHAWVQGFASELEAFRAYANSYPNSTLLLVDTYDTLKSGIPNAITVFHELRKKGHEPLGIRIDSGDLEYLSKKARLMLDEANFKNVKIVASDNLDENVIEHLKSTGARIDSWGVGTKLITSYDCPSLGGVYKLSAVMKDGEVIPKMKLSEDPRKMNNPCIKQVYRVYDQKTNKAQADITTLEDETIDINKPLEIFHPLYTYKKKIIENFYIKPLLKPLIRDGKLVQEPKKAMEARAYAKSEKATFWHEYLRNVKPETYKVDLSSKLWNIREKLIKASRIQA